MCRTHQCNGAVEYIEFKWTRNCVGATGGLGFDSQRRSAGRVCSQLPTSSNFGGLGDEERSEGTKAEGEMGRQEGGDEGREAGDGRMQALGALTSDVIQARSTLFHSSKVSPISLVGVSSIWKPRSSTTANWEVAIRNI